MSQSRTDRIEMTTMASSHNYVCFNYLKNLKISPRLLACFPEQFAQLTTLSHYDPTIAYGNLYTIIFDCIQDEHIIAAVNSELALAQARLEVQEDIKNQIPQTQKSFMKLFHHQLESQIKQLEDEKSTLEEQITKAQRCLSM